MIAGADDDEETGVADPTRTDPDKYKVIFENERVRVLEYIDEPGQARARTDIPTA